MLDLCSGGKSAKQGLAAYKAQVGFRDKWGSECLTKYYSVDYDEQTSPMLVRDLLDAEHSLEDVLERALAHAGWLHVKGSVAVFVWFSPPCETYSPIAIGTLSAPSKGGPVRQGKDRAYRPVRGRRGAEARAADRLVLRVLRWLHAAAKKRP